MNLHLGVSANDSAAPSITLRGTGARCERDALPPAGKPGARKETGQDSASHPRPLAKFASPTEHAAYLAAAGAGAPRAAGERGSRGMPPAPPVLSRGWRSALSAPPPGAESSRPGCPARAAASTAAVGRGAGGAGGPGGGVQPGADALGSSLPGPTRVSQTGFPDDV